MRVGLITSCFHVAVCRRLNANIDVFGEPINNLKPLGKRRSAFQLEFQVQLLALPERVPLALHVDNGRFVAVSLDTIEVKKHFLAESSQRVTATHIVVYDLILKKQILTVNVNPLPKNDYDFALSPDGSKLAVLNDRKVSVCGVPVQSTDHAETVRRETP